MGHHANPSAAVDAGSLVDPWVVALAEHRTVENRAVFGQLESLAGMWSGWAPEPLEQLGEVERRRHHASLRGCTSRWWWRRRPGCWP